VNQEPSEIFAEIKLQRGATPTRAMLIVEGVKDKKWFKGHFPAEGDWQVYTANGKKLVRKVIEKAEEENVVGVLGVVDRDFDHHLELDYSGPRILYTDLADFETTAVAKENCFNKFVQEHFDNARAIMQLIGSTDARDIAKFFMTLSGRIGCLRLLDRKHNWQLKFFGLRFQDFVESKNLQVNISKLIESLFENSKEPQITIDEVKQIYLDKTEILSNDDFEAFCTGHHICELISIALTEGGCSNYPEHINPEVIEKDLRLCLRLEHTDLYTEIEGWQNANSPFAFLDI